MYDETTYKRCRFCDEPFKRSPSDSTVYCPAHRSRESRRRTRTTSGPREVSPSGRTCTVRSAFGPCGEPAVYAFVSSTGEVFAECSKHH